jgi:D-alanyl-D-alanine carboxypeptidase
MFKLKPLAILSTIATLVVLATTSIAALAASSPSLKYIAENSKINQKDPVKYMGVLDTESGNFQHFNGDKTPLSLASTAKVLVAVAVLDDLNTGKYSMTTPITLPSWANATDGSAGATVKSNLYRMLNYSDNSATNALILKTGGFKNLNSKLTKYGITNSSIKCLLSARYINSNTCSVKNSSTMRDLVTAMNVIRKDNGVASNYMKDSMRTTPYTYNHTGRLYNKYGINSKALGDVGVLGVTSNGVKKEYVFAAMVEFTDGRGNTYDNKKDPQSGQIISTDPESKTDPISKSIQWLVNDLRSGFTIREGSY